MVKVFQSLPFYLWDPRPGRGVGKKEEFLGDGECSGSGDEEKKGGNKLMIVYIVFRKDYAHRKVELMGMLVERRKDMRGEAQWESGTKWARQAFGHLVKDKRTIFVYPKEMKINDKGLLIKNPIFSKEEYLELMRAVDQEIGRGGERELNRVEVEDG
jgi:hypothetical protein